MDSAKERIDEGEVTQMILRPYQQDLITGVKKQIISGKKSVVAVLGCGGGKSIIQATIARSATDKGNRVLFLVHRKELCDQIIDTFSKCGVDWDYCKVAMVQTVSKRLNSIETPSVIVVDECHHILSNTYLKIINHFPDAIKLGFTATPIRMGTGGLGKAFGAMVEGVSTKWLIENGFLAAYRYFSVKLADPENCTVKRGDYDSHELSALMEDSCIYGDTVRNYIKIANGKKTIVYCASIAASKATAAEFIENGITAAHLDGSTPKQERKKVVQAFRDGQITVLCNVDLFGEGLDVPNCECVILLRPTKSVTLYIQQAMRSMRYMEGKTAFIIDHVANVYEHGLPDDKREWSLKASKKKKGDIVKIRECPKCFNCMNVGVRVCEICGHEFMTEEQAEKEKVEIELQEINQEDVLKAKPYDFYKNITDFEEMKRFQKAKKFKFGWVIHKCEELGIEIPKNYSIMMSKSNFQNTTSKTASG